MWRKSRLRRRSDFLRLRAQGRTTQHSLMHMNVLENDIGQNRYGFITSKRLGKAVARNRVRRLLREAVRHHHLQLLQGYDVILIARAKLVGLSYADVLRHTARLFEQAGLLKRDF